MLWIFSSVLVVLWIIGLIKEPMGGFIHVLLGMALVAAGTELVLLWRRRNDPKKQSAFSNRQSSNPDASNAEGTENASVEDKSTFLLRRSRYLRRSG
jgi:uncharacterized protein DUF5670